MKTSTILLLGVGGYLLWRKATTGSFLGQPYGPPLVSERLRRVPPAPTRAVPTTFTETPVARATFEYPFMKKGRPLEKILAQVGAR